VFIDPLNALEKFRVNPQDYDLTITDIRMPSMNGIELANNIRTLRVDMLVLYISAFERDHEALEPIHGKQLAEDLLKKPVKMADLCAAVRKRIPAN
jgi:CheY-like chemotaxis protein